MIVVPQTDECNHRVLRLVGTLHKRPPIRWNQQKESHKKAAGGRIKLSRAVDKYAGPLALQLLVIMAERARYVALQLRLAALLVMR